MRLKADKIYQFGYDSGTRNLKENFMHIISYACFECSDWLLNVFTNQGTQSSVPTWRNFHDNFSLGTESNPGLRV